MTSYVYINHQSTRKWIVLNQNYYEFLESTTFNFMSAFGNSRQRLRIRRYRLLVVALWLGARSYCSFGNS